MGGKGVGSAAAGRVIAQDTKLYYTVGFSSSFLGYQALQVMRYIIIFNQPYYDLLKQSYFLFLFVCVAFTEHFWSTELSHLIS